jgi:ATP-dependent DNA helicase RecG
MGHQRPGLEQLKSEVAQHTNHQITFRDIHEIVTARGRVVLFQIPAAPRGIPTEWKGRVNGRHGESTSPLTLQEIEQIRNQAPREDWSAQICEGATLHDLDRNAVVFARQEFKNKQPALASEVDGWDDLTFLNKAKVCVGGKITRAAIILLGAPESTHFLTPSLPQITWILKDRDGMERDYQHFGLPFLLAVDPVIAKIRNLTCRVLPWGTLFPVELLQYDPWVLREVVHNAIAHQDYTYGGRVNVVEFEDRLVVANMGTFLPGDVENVIRQDAPFNVYRNAFLAQAMVGLQMIDTIGSGIKRMYQVQKRRSFPMPDYHLTARQEVQVNLPGKVLDEKYTRMLMARADLDLWDAIALDKVQKGKPISEDEFRSLKAKKLIEGRRPNLFVSAAVAAATETLVDYLRKRGIDKAYAQRMVVEFLEMQGQASRQDIEKLLHGKLSDALDDDQKRNFITNLLQGMRHDSMIRPVHGKRGKGAKWELCKPL